MYELFLFLHVLAVIAWLGAAMTFQVLALRARRGTPGERADVVQHNERLGPYYGIVSGITLLTGIALVLVVDGYEFETPWIAIALAGWLVSAAVGGAVLSPRSKAAAAAIRERGRDDAEASRLVDRLVAVARFDLVLLVLMVADMTMKPTFRG